MNGIIIPTDNDNIQIGDVTNFGVIEGITPSGNYVVNGNIVGLWRPVRKIKILDLF